MLERQDHCLNCKEKLPKEENFCPNCGQKNANLQLSFWALLQEMLGGLFNYDNRFWRSIPVFLFQPGKLTNAFIEGKRVSYIHPFRLYLLSSILFFFTFRSVYFSGEDRLLPENLMTTDNIQDSLENALDSAKWEQEINLDSLSEVLDDANLPQNIYAKEGIKQAKEAIKESKKIAEQYQEEKEESISTFSFEKDDSVYWKKAYNLAVTKPYLSDQAFLDSLRLPVEEDPILYIKLFHIVRDGGKSLWYLIVDNFSWAIMFLVPVFALWLKLFYSKRLYFTHLIFSLHWHAFIFVSGSIFILLANWLDNEMVLWGLIAVFTWYTWMMFARVMRVGGWKLFIKVSLLLYCYFWMVFWASLAEVLWMIWKV